MKRILVGLVVLLWAGLAMANPWYSISSGEKTADAVIFAGECFVVSCSVITDGTNNATVVLYDNASAASGTVLAEITVDGGNFFGGRNFQLPVRCANGIYADVTGTGASYTVEYINR